MALSGSKRSAEKRERLPPCWRHSPPSVSSEDDPLRLIAAIRPDRLFKGADYALDAVVGGDFVRSYGGEVRLIPLEAGESTTATISRIARQN